ncbi:MAG: Type 1 glutamine amidotransferase-like domain-containing protein [Butyrivibrio sp.]|nr:Type 1 glutamine amidotransferase-like domain-containing protein [Butyrivibrio sp.]
MKAILTSSLGGQVKIDGKRLPSKLPETNGLLKCIKDCWKKDSKVMIISGSPEYFDKNDSVLFCLKGAFSLSELGTSEVLMCDERNKEIIERLPEIDVLILAGGHVPTQNSFMKTIGLKERLQSWDGLLIAWSAGSMNCAEMVYAGPELPGEAIDPNYQRWISGLGITKTNIFPHFEALKGEMLDGMRLIEDITYSDSMGHEIIALNNGSFIVVDNGTEVLYGEAYSIMNGEQRQICTDDKWIAVCKAFTDPEVLDVQLNVFPENARAKRCYEGAGFTERQITPNAFKYKDESWGRCNMIIKR